MVCHTLSLSLRWQTVFPVIWYTCLTRVKKVKIKFALEQAMKVQRRSRDIALLIL